MSSNSKINILSDIKENPWGGGNQFLKSLRQELVKKEWYDTSPESADIIILDSYQKIIPALNFKRYYPQKYLIHRLGPIFHLHRGPHWRFLDILVSSLANHVDWVVFQSEWSEKEFKKLGFKNKNFSVIKNASDSQYFNTLLKKEPSQKIKLISYSWSSNPNKGFSTLKFLDENLDFSKYQITFIGNSPIKFKNIIQLDPLSNKDLATHLKKSDIFISASKDDACSNSIIEALSCKIPVIALNSGGNPELINQGGELFNNQSELINKINLVSNNLNKYRQDIKIDNIDTITEKYLDSIDKAQTNKPRSISFLFFLKIKFFLFLFNIYKKI